MRSYIAHNTKSPDWVRGSEYHSLKSIVVCHTCQSDLTRTNQLLPELKYPLSYHGDGPSVVMKFPNGSCAKLSTTRVTNYETRGSDPDTMEMAD